MSVLTSLVATAGSSTLAARLVWDLTAGLVELLAIVRTLKVPAEWWGHGRWSKLGAVVLVLWGILTPGGYVLPIGAALVIWHTRALGQKVSDPVVPDLPFAEGSPEEREEERA